VLLAKRYADEGADELVMLDISASIEGRALLYDVVHAISRQVFIPLTVGGGIRTVADVKAVLYAGADKVAINTAAIEDPTLIYRASQQFGRQCIVAAIDAKQGTVYSYGGRKNTGIDLLTWCSRVEELGAGEILLTSIDRDGTRVGYDLDMLSAVSKQIKIPLIASGGVGTIQHIVDLFQQAPEVDAALLASLIHTNQATLTDIKNQLKNNNIAVRI
jgi:cyclase